MDIFKVFQKWLRVKEVFISCRLNKWGRRFGFVRFFEMENVGHMGKELDQVYLGNIKLYVNIPRYRRAKHEVNIDRRREWRNTSWEESWKTRKQCVDVHVVNRKMRGKEVWVEKKGKKIFC